MGQVSNLSTSLLYQPSLPYCQGQHSTAHRPGSHIALDHQPGQGWDSTGLVLQHSTLNHRVKYQQPCPSNNILLILFLGTG